MQGNSVEPATLKAEVFCHSTEDPESVRALFLRIFREGAEITEEKLFGHYKNPIIKFSYRTENKKEIVGLIRNLSGLPVEIEGNKRAFFRLSKSALFEGRTEEPVISENQTVNIEASFCVFSGGDVSEYLRGIMD